MRFLSLLWMFFLGTAYAQSIPMNNALSFAPPPSDVSMMFLSSIFGVVDGVLAGSGSQIFGTMMKMFNSAVLALGSIVSTYVLLLGTMHTAHEGEFLGKKWSSILIPIRTTIGLGLLIPKTSGYCLIQIFFVWVVVQGIGAADKIWDAALNYLSQGGKIVMQQPSSADVIGTGSGQGQNQIYVAGIRILAGQVCMKGIEQILRNLQQQLRNSPSAQQLGNSPDDNLIKEFISADIPDFLGSVNAVTFASQNPTMNPLVLPMPNFTSQNGTGFGLLSGICGSISWKSVQIDFQKGGAGNISGDTNLNLSQSDVQTISQSRAVAVQTLYSFLSNVAVAMINNNPLMGNPSTQKATAAFYANLQFGLPNQNGDPTICKELGSSNSTSSDDATLCSTWGAASDGGNVPILFTGNEFTNAIKAYDAVMAPVFNLQRQMQQPNNAALLRQFIQQSQQDGWVFAGAYFFNFIALSGKTDIQSGDLGDSNSGLEATQGPVDDKADTLSQFVAKNCNPVGSTGSLCWYITKFNEPISVLQSLETMIRGGSDKPLGCIPVLTLNTQSSKSSGYISNTQALNNMYCSSTVYGFAGNSFYFNVPVSHNLDINNIKFNLPGLSVPSFSMPRQGVPPLGFLTLPSMIINLILDYLFYPIIDALILVVNAILAIVIQLVLVVPMQTYIWPMLQTGVQMLTNNLDNPIVDLANMGGYFIQQTINLYINLLVVAFIGAIPALTAVSVAIKSIMALIMPFLTAWLAFFTTIGFTTCYYVPMLPYIIFIFGVLSWLFSIVEAVVAAPLVALAVTTPEGEGLMGKGEQGLMILLNIFLRPSLMIIGFVSAIAMTYVSIWMLNSSIGISAKFLISQASDPTAISAGINWVEQGYTWPILLSDVMFLSFYVSTYVTLVQKVFSLIYSVPDKVLRWIGGREEGTGQEVNQWVEQVKEKIEDFTSKTQGAIAAGGAGLQKAAKDATDKDTQKKIKEEYNTVKSKANSLMNDEGQ